MLAQAPERKLQEVSSEGAAKKTGVAIFDSRFGNTQKVAESLAAGMRSGFGSRSQLR